MFFVRSCARPAEEGWATTFKRNGGKFKPTDQEGNGQYTFKGKVKVEGIFTEA